MRNSTSNPNVEEVVVPRPMQETSTPPTLEPLHSDVIANRFAAFEEGERAREARLAEERRRAEEARKRAPLGFD